MAGDQAGGEGEGELVRDYKRNQLALQLQAELKERYGLRVSVTKFIPNERSEEWIYLIDWWDDVGGTLSHVEGGELEEVLAGVLWLAVRIVVGPRQASFQNGALV